MLLHCPETQQYYNNKLVDLNKTAKQSISDDTHSH